MKIFTDSSKHFSNWSAFGKVTGNSYSDRSDSHWSMPSVLWHCWTDVRKSIWPVNGMMRCWCGYLSTERCRWFAYGPADATASSFASLKPRMVLPFWSWLTHAVLEKRQLKGIYKWLDIHSLTYVPAAIVWWMIKGLEWFEESVQIQLRIAIISLCHNCSNVTFTIRC